jgi:hypothetical protein
MTEAQLQAAVIELAQMLGYRTYHTHDSRRSTAGFPDLVMVRWEHLIFAELKSETGKISPEQAKWLDDLRLVADAFLWRPHHWLDGTIEKVLR